MDALILGLRVIVSLGAVFGLMWLLHRRLRAGNPGLRARVLSVVARQSVGPKASVVLVDTDGRRFLLGVTEHGINVLHTSDVPEPETSAVPGVAGALPRPTPDPTTDAVPATRRELRRTSFAQELRKQRDVQDETGTRGTGSVLEPATWRLAADALRSGRRS